VARHIREFDAEVIHTHGSTAHKYGAIYRVIGNVPIVATAHSRNLQLHWAFNDHVIAPSNDTAAYHRRVNLVPGRKVTVIPNMLVMDSVPQIDERDRARIRAELGIPDEVFVLGMIGTVCRRKNQIDCVRVLDSLLRDGVDARLVLIGPDGRDGHLRKLNALVRKRRLTDRVHYLGAKPDASTMLPAMNAYICTSRNEECSIANLEAMAAGLPMIATRVGCMDSLLADGCGGRLFDVGATDEMARYAATLARDPARSEVIGLEGREIIRLRLSPDEIVPKVEAIYLDLARIHRTLARA